MAGWTEVVHAADFYWVNGLFRFVCSMFVDIGSGTPRNEFSQMAAIHVYLHDRVGLPWSLVSAMDRKPDVESNYPRESLEVVHEMVTPRTSLMPPLVVAGMMIGVWNKFPHRGSFWGVLAVLSLILLYFAYKITWVEKQFWVYRSSKQDETLHAVNDSEAN